MNFYGVGVKFGGTDDMLPLFLKKDCWFMGWGEQEKPNMAKTISEINWRYFNCQSLCKCSSA